MALIDINQLAESINVLPESTHRIRKTFQIRTHGTGQDNFPTMVAATTNSEEQAKAEKEKLQAGQIVEVITIERILS